MSHEHDIPLRASKLAFDARDLAAMIGASDPTKYTGWMRDFERAEADIAEIRRRIDRHKNKEAA